MKKSIANKIEKAIIITCYFQDQKNEDANKRIIENETDEQHFEKNPDTPYNIKLPARLMELLCPKRNPGYR